MVVLRSISQSNFIGTDKKFEKIQENEKKKFMDFLKENYNDFDLQYSAEWQDSWYFLIKPKNEITSKLLDKFSNYRKDISVVVKDGSIEVHLKFIDPSFNYSKNRNDCLIWVLIALIFILVCLLGIINPNKLFEIF